MIPNSLPAFQCGLDGTGLTHQLENLGESLITSLSAESIHPVAAIGQDQFIDSSELIRAKVGHYRQK